MEVNNNPDNQPSLPSPSPIQNTQDDAKKLALQTQTYPKLPNDSCLETMPGNTQIYDSTVLKSNVTLSRLETEFTLFSTTSQTCFSKCSSSGLSTGAGISQIMGFCRNKKGFGVSSQRFSLPAIPLPSGVGPGSYQINLKDSKPSQQTSENPWRNKRIVVPFGVKTQKPMNAPLFKLRNPGPGQYDIAEHESIAHDQEKKIWTSKTGPSPIRNRFRMVTTENNNANVDVLSDSTNNTLDNSHASHNSAKFLLKIAQRRRLETEVPGPGTYEINKNYWDSGPTYHRVFKGPNRISEMEPNTASFDTNPDFQQDPHIRNSILDSSQTQKSPQRQKSPPNHRRNELRDKTQMYLRDVIGDADDIIVQAQMNQQLPLIGGDLKNSNSFIEKHIRLYESYIPKKDYQNVYDYYDVPVGFQKKAKWRRKPNAVFKSSCKRELFHQAEQKLGPELSKPVSTICQKKNFLSNVWNKWVS